MPRFDYQARDKEGGLKTGTITAMNESSANDVLRGKDLIPISIMSQEQVPVFQKRLSFFKPVSTRDLVIFSRQFATMVDAKLPILTALRTVAKQTERDRFRDIIEEIANDIEGGAALSEALAKHPKIFSTLYISMIQSGETTGRIDESLEYLASQLEKDYDLTKEIQSALFYPAIVLTAIVIVGILMFIFVLPTFNEIFSDVNVQLPLTTRIVIGVTNFINKLWWLILIIVIVLVWVFFAYRRTPEGEYYTDGLMLKIPVFGKLFKYIYLTRFSRNFGTLISGEIPVIKALEVTASVVGNKVYQEVILNTARDVEKGEAIADSLAKSELMPPMICQMIKVGEKSGQLDEVLQNVARFYGREVDHMVDNLTTLMGPIIIVILGLAVATMVAAVLMPIYSLVSVM